MEVFFCSINCVLIIFVFCELVIRYVDNFGVVFILVIDVGWVEYFFWEFIDEEVESCVGKRIDEFFNFGLVR